MLESVAMDGQTDWQLGRADRLASTADITCGLQLGRADRLASTADITCGLQLGRADRLASTADITCGLQLGRADRLASTADITCGLQLGRAEKLRSVRNVLNVDGPEHHSVDHMKKRGVEKGSSRPSTFQIWKQPVFQKDNHWHGIEGNFGETAETQS